MFAGRGLALVQSRSVY